MHMIETPQSSQIESAGHENDVLHVLFRSGALYAYYGVPRPLFIDLINDSSPEGILRKVILTKDYTNSQRYKLLPHP